MRKIVSYDYLDNGKIEVIFSSDTNKKIKVEKAYFDLLLWKQKMIEGKKITEQDIDELDRLMNQTYTLIKRKILDGIATS
jgi:hypothetical protein